MMPQPLNAPVAALGVGKPNDLTSGRKLGDGQCLSPEESIERFSYVAHGDAQRPEVDCLGTAWVASILGRNEQGHVERRYALVDLWVIEQG